MTISKLRHRFPRALPKLVTDVEDWLARTDLLLELLKDAVHSGNPLLSADILRSGVLPKRWTDEVTRIKATRSSLASVMDAVTFTALSDLQPCQEDQIEWLELHSEPLSELLELDAENACELPMLLFSVRDVISPRLLQTTVRCLTDPAIQTCRWQNMDRDYDQLKDALKKAIAQNEYSWPDPPCGESLGALVRSVLFQTASQRSKRRRESFDLLGQLLKPELIDRIAESQREISSGERRLRRLLRRVESGHETIPSTKSGRKAWLENAKGDQDIGPANIAAAKSLGKTLCGIRNDPNESGNPWTRFLASFPVGHAGLAIRLMTKWRHDWCRSTERKNDLGRVLEPLSWLLHRRGIAAPLLNNWRAHVEGSNAYFEFVTDTCYEVVGKPSLAKRAVNLLEKTLYDLQLNLGPELMASLVEFAEVTNDDALSASIIEQLSKNADESYCDTEIRVAILFGDSPAQVAQILFSFNETGDLDGLAAELKPIANDPDLRRIVAMRIIEGETTLLMRLAATISILNDLGRPLPKWESVSKPLDWCSRYPDDFQSALQSLSESTPDSERIAAKVLGKFLPTREALQRQIDALQSKLDRGLPPEIDEARMRRRLENLQRRLVDGVSVSSKRRGDLIEKLRRRADEERLRRFALLCRRQVVASMSEHFEIQEFPEDLLSPPLDRVLREINRLGTPIRKLGMRLLFESACRTTHSFDEEPKNLAFANRMESIGINMHPWLGNQLRQTAEMADGTAYALAFTRNAVDFLLMGFHFDTCLSPDSFNFFSTVANAVDVNKRVVYGKTELGRVIGRCLFALNESGEILTYHRYSHDPKDGFDAAVDRFAQRLADEMQTCLGSGGQVARLVASDWYDDGPIGGNLGWLEQGGLVSDLVKRVESDQLLSELIDAVGENVLRGRVVEVATNANLNDRSEFLSALLDQFGSGMSFRQRFIVAVNVEPEHLRARLLSEMRWREIVRFVHRHQCDECDVFHGIAEYSRVFRVLTEYHPSLGLRAIRAARPSSIQDDLQDPNRTRRKALIEAHRLLGRQHLAEKLQKK